MSVLNITTPPSAKEMGDHLNQLLGHETCWPWKLTSTEKSLGKPFCYVQCYEYLQVFLVYYLQFGYFDIFNEFDKFTLFWFLYTCFALFHSELQFCGFCWFQRSLSFLMTPLQAFDPPGNLGSLMVPLFALTGTLNLTILSSHHLHTASTNSTSYV